MNDSSQRALAETVFQRDETGERAPSDALSLEEARRAAAVENMRHSPVNRGVRSPFECD